MNEITHFVLASLHSIDRQVLRLGVPVALLDCGDTLISDLSCATVETVVMLSLDMKDEFVILVLCALRDSLEFVEGYFSLHCRIFVIADSRCRDEEVSFLFQVVMITTVFFQLC